MRMRAAFQRALIGSVFLAALAPSLAAELNPIKLRIAGKECAAKPPALYDGKEVYISLNSLKSFGAGHRLTRRQDAVEVFPQDAKAFEIGLARLKRNPMIPLAALAAKLDAEVTVTDQLCDVRARIYSIEFGEDSIRVAASFPVAVSAKSASGARSYVTLSIAGASLPADSDTLKASWAEAGVLTSRFENTDSGVILRLEMRRGTTALAGDFDAAREHVVLLERPARAASAKAADSPNLKTARVDSGTARSAPKPLRRPALESPQAASRIDLDLSSRRDVRQNPNTDRIQEPESVDPQNPAIISQPALRVTEVSLRGVNPLSATLKIGTSGKVEPVMHLVGDPDRLLIDLPSCALPEDTKEWRSEHSLVSAIHVGESEAPGVSRIVVVLSRAAGYRLVHGGPEGLTIALAVPRGGTGKSLRDIVIVVDPGHGGDANGCNVKVGDKRYNEKTITLSISRKLRALLEEAGANVIMTRTGDQSVGLYDRSGLANDNNANLFVSIHVDWISKSGPRGHTVYHHMSSNASRQFAKMVVERMAESSGIPSRGAVSDKKLYRDTGLAVLRTSTMPAILVETGFLSNPADRQKLIDEKWHQVMAESIFNGIRDYVEGPSSNYSIEGAD